MTNINKASSEFWLTQAQYEARKTAGTLVVGAIYHITDAAYASEGIIADEYDATETYAVGDYCMHDGALYICSTAISVAEAWTAAHWTEATVGEELVALKESKAQLPGHRADNKLYLMQNDVWVELPVYSGGVE